MTDRNAALDRRLQVLAGTLREVAEDWAEPADGREIFVGAVQAAISNLRRIADDAEAAVREFTR